VNSAIVPRVWIGELAGETKMISNVGVAKQGIDRATDGSILSNRLRGRDAKNVSAADNINSCDDWIEWSG
jgi:hypothetical protein